MSTITSGDGDNISVSSTDTCVVVEIAEAGGSFSASIWLTPDQSDELFRAVAAARVEISKAKPTS